MRLWFAGFCRNFSELWIPHKRGCSLALSKLQSYSTVYKYTAALRRIAFPPSDASHGVPAVNRSSKCRPCYASDSSSWNTKVLTGTEKCSSNSGSRFRPRSPMPHRQSRPPLSLAKMNLCLSASAALDFGIRLFCFAMGRKRGVGFWLGGHPERGIV